TCLLGRRLPLLPPPTSVPYTTLFRSLPKWLIPRPRRGGAPGTAGRADRRCAGAAGNPRAAWTIESRRRRPEAAAGRRSGRGRDAGAATVARERGSVTRTTGRRRCRRRQRRRERRSMDSGQRRRGLAWVAVVAGLLVVG